MDKVSVIISFLSLILSLLAGIFSYYQFKVNQKPVVQVSLLPDINLEKGTQVLGAYRLYIKNHSNYNIYNFTIRLKEELADKSGFCDQIKILSIDGTTLGATQEYSTTMITNREDISSNIKFITFIIEYNTSDDWYSKKYRNEIKINMNFLFSCHMSNKAYYLN